MLKLIKDKNIHHLGFAVRDAKISAKQFEVLGFQIQHTITDEKRNLDFTFMAGNELLIELVSPHDSSKKSVVSVYIEKSPCTPYHICMTVKNLNDEISRLRKEGFRQVGEKITSDIYGYNSTGVFLYSLGAGLIELVQEN